MSKGEGEQLEQMLNDWALQAGLRGGFAGLGISRAWDVVEYLVDCGYAFACWYLPSISSVMVTPRAAFKLGVSPPRPEEMDNYAGNAWNMPQAIYGAASQVLSSVKGIPGK